VAVVFLARGRGGGLSGASAFLDSYRAHAAGAPHSLVLLRKGFDLAKPARHLEKLASQHDARLIDLPDDGHDWGAYFRAARLLTQEWLLFLNTHSRLVAGGWLADYRVAAEGKDVGVVGATASWEGPRHGIFGTALAQARQVARNRTWMHGCIEAAQQLRNNYREGFRRREVPGFPNSYIRSNAFLIRRDLFCAFAHRSAMPRDKQDAVLLEHGKKGLTRMLLAEGRQCLVVARGGAAFAPSEWDRSGTFRVPGQPGLLVSDNLTRLYMDSCAAKRRVAEIAAWGRPFTPATSPCPDRPLA
jgi:hypothetical protein